MANHYHESGSAAEAKTRVRMWLRRRQVCWVKRTGVDMKMWNRSVFGYSPAIHDLFILLLKVEQRFYT